MPLHSWSLARDIVITSRRYYTNSIGYTSESMSSSKWHVWFTSRCPGRRLSTWHSRSADVPTCVVPRTLSSYGDRTFTAAGPCLWNSLPVQLCNPYITCKTYLLTFLHFMQATWRNSETSRLWQYRKVEDHVHVTKHPSTLSTSASLSPVSLPDIFALPAEVFSSCLTIISVVMVGGLFLWPALWLWYGTGYQTVWEIRPSAETPSSVHWRCFYFQRTHVHSTLKLFGRCILQIYLLTYLLTYLCWQVFCVVSRCRMGNNSQNISRRRQHLQDVTTENLTLAANAFLMYSKPMEHVWWLQILFWPLWGS